MVYPEPISGPCEGAEWPHCRMLARVAAPIAFLLMAGVASAQLYPQTYPGQRRYPGGTAPQIPVPGKKTKEKTADPAVPLPSFRGFLKQMDNKSITIRLDDFREMDFKRTDKTKFFKNGEELKTPDFKPGDQVSVEGPEDAQGYMTAVNVYWEKAASAESAAKPDKSEGDVDAWKDAPPPKPSVDVKPAPAKPDPDDPGPPRLQRGKPVNTARERAEKISEETPQVASAAPAGGATAKIPAATPPPPAAPPSVRPATGRDEPLPFGNRQEDPLIRKASDTALDFTETLPNYVCTEMIARFQSETRPVNWQPLDVVSTEVVYDHGKEDYRNIAINGKPVKKRIEEVGGAWSTGEFGTILISLFSPATNAQFRFRKNSRIAGIDAKEYTYEVTRENSHWTIQVGSQTYRPAYSGAVWIDPSTGRVLRIEMAGKGFPSDFPSDQTESATDYQYVRLGDARQFLLPVHSETLSCQRGTNNCSRNVIDFRNYHKFEGESTIRFGDKQ